LTEAGQATAMLRRVTAGAVTAPAQRIQQVSADVVRPQASGLAELDRVLGGGLIPGGVVLLAGEPGVGKSTLLLAAAHAWAARGQGSVLIVSGEESAPQIRLRADRMGALHPDIYLAAENDLAAVLGHLEAVRPKLLIVDSVQTIATAEVDGSAGGVSQVRAVAAALTAVSDTSPRTVPLRAPGCWNIWWMWSCSSRAIATPACGPSAESRTATGPPMRSAASRWCRMGSSVWPIRPACS
jgi:DNA repair protein RadA/Sms